MKNRAASPNSKINLEWYWNGKLGKISRRNLVKVNKGFCVLVPIIYLLIHLPVELTEILIEHLLCVKHFLGAGVSKERYRPALLEDIF